MANFEYKATSPAHQTIQDTIVAASESEAKLLLTDQKYQVIWIKKINSPSGKLSLPRSSVPIIEKANLCRYLATMVGAGLSLPEAVEVFARDNTNPRLKAILTRAESQLQQGKNLSSALEQYPQVFDNIIIALIKAGERSGTLNESLRYLADYLYSEYKLRQKVKGAIMYPIIILTAMLGVGLLLIFFVLPRMAPVFLSLKVSLPFYTRVILQSGLFVSKYAIIVLPATLIGLGGVAVFLMRPTGRKIAIKIVSIIPAIRKLLDYLDLARFCRTLATLLSSGVPITEAMNIVTNALSQNKYKLTVGKFSEELQKGTSLAELLRSNSKLFPQITVRMISAGEKSGTVEDMLRESAEYYENEVEDILSNFATIIEPVLLLLVGIGVGVMVVAIIGPIYSLVGGLQGNGGL